RASMRAVTPVVMMSFLVPGSQPVESRRLEGNSSAAGAAGIRDGGFDDIAVTPGVDGGKDMLGCVMRGGVFWVRVQKGNLARLLAINARSFKHGDEIVFESEEPVPYVQAYFWENGIVIEHGENNERKVYVRDLRDRQFQRH